MEQNNALEHKIDLALAASNMLIENAAKRLEQVVEREAWSNAASIENYISGMKQILAIFKLAADTNEKP